MPARASFSCPMRPSALILGSFGLSLSLGCSRPAAPVVVAIAAPPAETGAPGPRASGASGGAPANVVTPAQFSFAVDVGGTWAILVDAAPDDSAAGSEPTLVSDPTDFSLMARADAAPEITASIHGLNKGDRFTFYEGDTPRCDGDILGYAIIARFGGPITDILPYDPSAPSPTDAEVTQATWSAGTRDLVALVDAPRDCGQPTWARSSALRPPRFAERKAAPADLQDRTEVAFRSLPSAVAARDSFQEEQARRAQTGGQMFLQAQWDEEAVTEVIRTPWNGRTLLRRTASVGEPCDFSLAHEATWDARGEGLSLVAEQDGIVDLQLLLDVDGDGRLEAIVGSNYLENLSLVPWPGDGTADALRSTSVVHYGCPC